MLYPHLSDNVAIATLHNELYQLPEEFSSSRKNTDTAESSNFTANHARYRSLEHTEIPLASTALLNILPFEDLPPSLRTMPLLSWSGERVDQAEMQQSANSYRTVFRHEVGGCDPNDGLGPWERGNVADLFCEGEAIEIYEKPVVALFSSVAPPAPSMSVSSDELPADLGKLVDRDIK
jgi:hypothetical protein